MVDDTDSVSDAFAALGDETRVDILRALVDARREDPENPELSFSDLRERVGVTDSGRFNYHLGKLRGRFVESDDGAYELTEAGNEVVGAILAGTYGDAVSLEPTVLDGECPLCETPLEASFDDGVLHVECEAEHPMLVTTVPPAAATNRSMTDLVEFAVRTTYAQLELVTAGICSECYGPVTADIRPVEVDDDEMPELPEYAFHTECERCGYVTGSAAAVAAVRHPAFVAFCHDHGVNVDERLPWTLPGLVDDRTERVESDPPRYRTPIEIDDERLEVTLDERGTVLDVERTPV